MYRALIGLAAATLILHATPAAAQRRTAPAPRIPAAGMWAGGGSIGAAAPADAALQNGLDVAGNLERFFTPRVSVRGQLGASWWDIQGHSFTGTVKPMFATGNVVYNWEGGAIHPFVTGGVGMYRYRSEIGAGPDTSDTKAGVNLGGGIEYFLTKRATVTGEALYHKTGAFNTRVATFNDGSFWTLALGLKAYLGR